MTNEQNIDALKEEGGKLTKELISSLKNTLADFAGKYEGMDRRVVYASVITSLEFIMLSCMVKMTSQPEDILQNFVSTYAETLRLLKLAEKDMTY